MVGVAGDNVTNNFVYLLDKSSHHVRTQRDYGDLHMWIYIYHAQYLKKSFEPKLLNNIIASKKDWVMRLEAI